MYYDIKDEIEIKEERIGEIAEEISDLRNGYIDSTYDLQTEISLRVNERQTLSKEIAALKRRLASLQNKDREF